MPKPKQRTRIAKTPDDALIDVTRRIELHGFPPGKISRNATLREAAGSLWRGRPTVLTDGADLDPIAPESGDWRDASAIAIVWSMRRAEDAPGPPESTARPRATPMPEKSPDGKPFAFSCATGRGSEQPAAKGGPPT
jgi:hypothetical protein